MIVTGYNKIFHFWYASQIQLSTKLSKGKTVNVVVCE